jgi:hypothetical protein
MVHARLTAALLAAATLAVAGCGGSSKTQSTNTATTAAATATTPTNGTTIAVATGRPLTQATWIAKGDAICTSTNHKMAAISIVSLRELARLEPQIAVYSTNEGEELGKLVPPSSAAHDWAHIVNNLRIYSEYTQKVGQEAQANHFSAAGANLKAARKVHLELQAIARRYGFKYCSKNREF